MSSEANRLYKAISDAVVARELDPDLADILCRVISYAEGIEEDLKSHEERYKHETSDYY